MKAVGYPERRWDTFPVKKRGDLFNGTAAYFVPLCLSLVTRHPSQITRPWSILECSNPQRTPSPLR